MMKAGKTGARGRYKTKMIGARDYETRVAETRREGAKTKPPKPLKGKPK